MRTIFTLVFLIIFSSCAFAQTVEERLQELEKTMKKQDQSIQELKALQKKTVRKQEKTIDEQRKLIEKLTAKVKQPPSACCTTRLPRLLRRLRQSRSSRKSRS